MTAEYDPAALEGLLLASSDYPLEEALRVCEARGMVPEQVLVLGRMGATDRALRLIVENLRDVGRAVEFVQNQRDDELWDLLITLALADPELTGALLDHAGGGVDPLAVVSRLPRHAHIPRLGQRLRWRTEAGGPSGVVPLPGTITDCSSLSQPRVRKSWGVALATSEAPTSTTAGRGLMAGPRAALSTESRALAPHKLASRSSGYRAGDASSAANAGSTKARVLPDPVWAVTQASGLPAMAQEVDSSDEPRLKYSALSPDTSIPGTALLLAVSDKVLALGTSTGAVLVLDYNGNQVQAFKEHHAAVTDLSFDAEAEYLASCSADGWVVIYGLYTGDIRRHNCHQPLTTVALDPRYSERKTREFVHGSQSGTLTLISKGWLGSSETPLFRGRGAVQVARMAGTLLAWVTATGLRVYDTATHTRLAKIPAPKTPAGEAAAPASLLWLGIRELYVGWGRTVLVLRVVRDSLVPSASSSAASAYSVPALRMETVVSIQVPFSVAGLAPFGVELAVLGTAVESLLGKGEAGGAKGSKPADGPVPPAPRFLHVLDRSGRILSSDELDVGPGATLAVFYTESAHRASEAVEKGTGLAPTLVLEALPKGGDSRVAGAGAADAGTASSEPSSDASALPGAPDDNASHDSPSDRGSSHPAASANASPAATTVDTASPVHALPTPHPAPPATPPPALSQPYKWWRDGDEPLYFLTSGSGTVVGRPRDGNDRVAWMMERGRIAEALAVAESDATVTRPVREAVGEQYLQYLVDRDEWAATAAAAPRLLQGRALAWERWVHVFAGARELRRLAPHLPVSEPQLRTRTYDMVLQALLVSPNDHGLLLDLVRRWPASTYSVRDVQRAVLSRLAAAGTGPCALDDVLTPGAAPDPRRADLMRAADEHEIEEAGVNASKAPPASRLSPLRRKPSRRLSGDLKAA
ncbi:hypothetical protein APUTEX25_004111 [Auxenochlorella protothecoides]|uniref:Vps41 beta-propeller domain-containing protein n=1 Tax=Auxenochlorella protothecoides TaxID=3075 RepID=A0A3M7L3W8_AUXPR|nr:hypothetical protein APUTEX25_004111 [Auxenochlorella protothecoides]|eukprot:RMZ57277.1 hypothetical protein APUTEX25_004111 [Auxenochlorella protothecoides]